MNCASEQKSKPEPAPGRAAERAGERYRFRHLSTRLFLDDLAFLRDDAAPGSIVPDLPVIRPDGRTCTLSGVLNGQHGLLVFGSASCPMTFGSLAPLNRLFAEFGTRVRFITVYVREAHPGEHLAQPQTIDLKMRHARILTNEARVPWEMAVDDIDGTLHGALATKPNAAYLLGPGRTVLFRSLWAGDEPGLRTALETVVQGRPLARTESTATLRPVAESLGFFPSILERSGRQARRDLVRAAPPVALMAWVASHLSFLPRARRGGAAIALMAVATIALVALATVWLA